ncbi:MAG: response regulator transcription factor [Lachnospiraceae bacterium]|jgi:Response regulator of the LytR/AlgR family|nr:response regulator transcription factor [Lachnospiraceae bacterium]
MKIVICDDCVKDLQRLERLLQKYRDTAAGIHFEVEEFTDACRLYERILQGDQADIYLLDMIMSEKNGIEIGSLIRQNGGGGVIIYVTTSADFALEAYEVHASRYLLKPVSEEHFFEAMDFALYYQNAEKNPLFPVKTKNGTLSVPYSKIEYIENYSRMLNVFLADGENIKSIFIRKSFDEEIKEISGDRSFLRIHKSFLINMNHVKKLGQGNIIMESGRRIPVSKTRAAEVKREYLQFISECYR